MLRKLLNRIFGMDEGPDAKMRFQNYIDIEVKKANGKLIKRRVKNLVVNQGVDWCKDLMSNPATTETKGALLYIALSPNTITASATDTSLSGEYTGVGAYGLARAAGAYASTGTGTWSISKTFTVGAGGSNMSVNSAGLYFDASGNSLFAEANISPAISGLSAGDQVTMTWNGTLTPS